MHNIFTILRAFLCNLTERRGSPLLRFPATTQLQYFTVRLYGCFIGMFYPITLPCGSPRIARSRYLAQTQASILYGAHLQLFHFSRISQNILKMKKISKSLFSYVISYFQLSYQQHKNMSVAVDFCYKICYNIYIEKKWRSPGGTLLSAIGAKKKGAGLSPTPLISGTALKINQTLCRPSCPRLLQASQGKLDLGCRSVSWSFHTC